MTSGNLKPGSNHLKIAIDGTAGAGKTTIGQMLAEQLSCPYLDTGAMYRAVALLSLRAGLKPDAQDKLETLARNMNFVARNATPAEAEDGRQYTVLLDAEDVSQLLRSPEVEATVSPIAAIPGVRRELVEKQRQLAADADHYIMIGRDIGSVVLPNADLKVYLDASPEVRALRRSQQVSGNDGETQAARQFITQRDKIDSGRSVSPLVVPDGALYINTDDLTVEEVLERIKIAITNLSEEKAKI